MNTVIYDQWRQNYQTASLSDHSTFYDACFQKDPSHASWAGRGIRVFLNQTGGNPVVAEMGGRNGSLAKIALESTPTIKRWINYEISPAALTSNVVNDERYEAKLMTSFRWWLNEAIEGNVIIASHFIEHLSDEDFKSFVGAIPRSIKGIHVQSPIPMKGPMSWNHFNGGHILSLGWVDVNEEFVKNGFRSIVAYDGATWIRP